MKVLVTGAKGFVGKNLCLTLSRMEGVEVMRYDLDNTPAELDAMLGSCDFVMHLAGVNRPQDPSEFKTGNTVFTEDILERLVRRGAKTPIALASSTQAALDNDYGRSKKAAEDAVFAYAEQTGAPVFVYRFANVFGKWCRPNYNSAVATWCHNIAHDLPIMVRDPNAQVTLIYIDDVVAHLVGCLEVWKFGGLEVSKVGGLDAAGSLEVSKVGGLDAVGSLEVSKVGGLDQTSKPPNLQTSKPRTILSVQPSYTRSLGEITDLLYSFHKEPENLMVPDQADGFSKKLYSTYLSYLPEDKFSYPVTMHCDNRGSFTELLHTVERGQVSVNISKPGITKGQHWHHTKHEKFCVVSGKGLIQFRKMDEGSLEVSKVGGVDQTSKHPNIQTSKPHIIDYHVSGDKIEVVRIPPGYTHNIINEGDTDMVTVMWANEVFDPLKPDTFFEKVQ